MAEHDMVTPAVTVCHEFALLHVGYRSGDASPFLGSVAVGHSKTSRQTAVAVHLHLGAEHPHILALKPWFDPVDDTGGYHQHLVTGCEGIVHGALGFGACKAILFLLEVFAQLLEILLRHSLDEMADEFLLGLATP